MFKRVVLYVFAAVLGVACSFVLSGVFTVTEVLGSGMEPSIQSGSKVLVNKIAFGNNFSNAPKTGSVVAFISDVYGEEGEGRILVRRVAGSPGDTIEVKDNIFYLNDKPYTDYMSEAAHMETFEKTRLKNDEIFVLSDNRKSSMDSLNEAIGILKLQDCIGKVCF